MLSLLWHAARPIQVPKALQALMTDSLGNVVYFGGNVVVRGAQNAASAIPVESQVVRVPLGFLTHTCSPSSKQDMLANTDFVAFR
jgi:hypothetical protein